MSDKKETAVIDIHNRVTGDELERLLKMQLKALCAVLIAADGLASRILETK